MIETSTNPKRTDITALPDFAECRASTTFFYQWRDLLSDKISCCDDPVKLWRHSLYPILRYMCGLISLEQANANLWPYDAKAATRLSAIADPNALTNEDFRTLGDFLRQSWAMKGWSDYWGHLDPYLVTLANTPVYPVERFYTGEERIHQLCSGEALPQLLQYFTRGVALVTHLRILGIHMDDNVVEPVDNVLLVETARDYLPLWFALREKLRDNIPTATSKYNGSALTQSFADFFDWGALVILDPTVHDVSRSAFLGNASLRKLWPQGGKDSIPHYMQQIFEPLPEVDANGTPTGTTINPRRLLSSLRELLDVDWPQKGFRAPTSLNRSFFELDFVKSHLSPHHERPLAQSVFMYALYPPQAGYGIGDTDDIQEDFRADLLPYLS